MAGRHRGIRITDLDRGEVANDRIEEFSGAPAEFSLVQWQLQAEHYYRVFFVARNGQWRQDLILRRSEAANCWLAATRIFGPKLEQRFQQMDHEFESTFGPPAWRN